ncbi:MAG: antibiotic biosynthesis monooxygenase [Bacteroidetes bacterium]|uniref:Antibiotic biosynthesis monooxygenase n=1 Tax=Phaeocystidibacter marisrubri TaxID=1577780 RepID=A0A6L3ZH97_9FLAO|nr:antibiotic biosynthesis monooxygenase family protein [Phaeocystidibacter marisrubri]KAB2816999.1 antibiotic biosynthesis monooxygenase [Phaeocystidibacter marisrubri]TNE31442.1 MAG: antibiotic biosynthesis monooxygenase [Bacteroidota bacterium]GGH77271.1 antibiotic biosynthesis monooxygenase [Phaeocystidibacter marisrubri]
MIVRVVKMHFRAEEIDNFRALFESRKEFIRGFEGCEYLELWQDVNTPEIFFTYSHWTHEDRLENYRKSELFKDVWSKTKALFAEKPQAWSVEPQVKMP